MAKGFILYKGPSRLDGSPIVVIATYGSKNRKTGGLIQTWIIRSRMDPIRAVKTGKDAGICGDCPHRGDGTGKGRSCYVNIGQAPLAIYRAYKRGAYPDYSKLGSNQRALIRAVIGGKTVRLGSYGDPVAVPMQVWQVILNCAGHKHTGYTHQWRSALAEGYQAVCMASCDSAADRADAKAKGWRTFRVMGKADEKVKGEVICPASEEAGKRLTCEQCGICDGIRKANDLRGDVTIYAHGGIAVKANAQRNLITLGLKLRVS